MQRILISSFKLFDMNHNTLIDFYDIMQYHMTYLLAP